MAKINVTQRERDVLESIPYATKGLLLEYSIKQLRQAADNAIKHVITFEMALDQLTVESKNHAI